MGIILVVNSSYLERIDYACSSKDQQKSAQSENSIMNASARQVIHSINEGLPDPPSDDRAAQKKQPPEHEPFEGQLIDLGFLNYGSGTNQHGRRDWGSVS